MRALHQQPAFPLFPDQILCHRVGQHRARRRDVDHIAAAILLAQAVVGRPCIQEDRAAVPDRVRRFQHGVGRQVRDDECDLATGEGACRGGRIFIALQANLIERKALVEKPAGGVVVLDREASAGDTVVLGGLHGERQRGFDPGTAEIADLDLGEVGSEGG